MNLKDHNRAELIKSNPGAARILEPKTLAEATRVARFATGLPVRLAKEFAKWTRAGQDAMAEQVRVRHFGH